MKLLFLVDVWRLYPLERQCSFFPPLHGSFSKTEYFPADSKLMLNILSSTYYIIINIIIIVSDQAPLSLKIFMYQLEIEPFSTVRLMFL